MPFPLRRITTASDETAAYGGRKRRAWRIALVFIIFSTSALINIRRAPLYDADALKETLIEALVSKNQTITFGTKEQMIVNRVVGEEVDKKYNLYCHLTERQINEKIKHFLCDGWNESDRLIQVDESQRNEPEVIWVTSEFKEIAPVINTSMQMRLKRHGKSLDDNLSMQELDEIDPGWKLFFYDISDNGIGNGWLWNINNTISPIVGCKRINFLTRTTQNGRRMHYYVNELRSGKKISMASSQAKPMNFTRIFEEEKLNPVCASVQRLSFYAREDINNAIHDYLLRRNISIEHDSSLGNSHTISRLPRETDVRTFWNDKVCNTRCAFRNFVTKSILQMTLKHPEMKVNTEIAGYTRGRGRRNVHRAYIRGLLGTKIIVVAQRDKWEDHLRLDEALLSGALVLHDPQTYWPHLMIDGVNYVVYHSMSDLESKILYYLNPVNEQERITIGQNGRELALRHHFIWHQAERVLLNDMIYRNEYGLYNKPWINGTYSPSIYP